MHKKRKKGERKKKKKKLAKKQIDREKEHGAMRQAHGPEALLVALHISESWCPL